MGEKKRGRPLASNPKDYTLKIRMDKETADKLNNCIEVLDKSKSEIIRRGIHKVHDDLNTKK